jgi:transcriptional regulator with XRE-family HTH domain
VITNERQQRITAAEAKRFERAIARTEQEGPAPGVDRRLHRATIAGMRSQLKDLRDELGEYEALREGKITRRVFHSFLEAPDALIEGRIARGFTQKQLGQKLGLPEQEVQRYEQTRYRAANVERLQEVADALGIRLTKTAEYDVRRARPRKGTSTKRPRKAASKATTFRASRRSSKAKKS